VNDVLASLSSDFESMYARMGRPSIPPEQLLHHDADGQSVSVFHQGMTHETQLALLAINHSPAYWRSVKRVVPDYEVSRQWLKDQSSTLVI
jgi:hypothetical protein